MFIFKMNSQTKVEVKKWFQIITYNLIPVPAVPTNWRKFLK